MNVGEQINFYIDGHKSKRVDRFKYPGSYVTKDCNGDAEITARIQCVIPLMIYGSETLTLYNHHIKPLRTVHQRHLRSIPNIRWDHLLIPQILRSLVSEIDYVGCAMLLACHMNGQ